MIEITRILCPVDFSECSRRALQYAAATARWYGSRLTVLHVLRYLPPVDIIPLPAFESARRTWFEDADRTELTEAAQRFVQDAVGRSLQVDLVIEDAPQVHREIVDRASVLKADLVVMGSHGRSGFERLLLGSIAEKVLRTARPPVMVVPPHVDAAVPAGDVRFDNTHHVVRAACCPILTVPRR